MTKLRNRLLITLILAAVAMSAIGVGAVSARTRAYVRGARTVPTTAGSVWSSKARTPIGPYSGEPDAGNGTAPKQSTKPTTVNPTGAFVDGMGAWTQLWALWLTRR
jgi:hypothetical protein